jgi:hypothetical protein
MASLTDFDDAATAVPAGGIDKKMSALADGEYEFNIEKVVNKSTKSGNLFTMHLMVMNEGVFAGKLIEHDYWLTGMNKDKTKEELREMTIGQLRADLGKLGFDEENWTVANNRKFFSEFLKAVLLMEGMRFKGKVSKNKQYTNFNVVERILGDCQEAKIGEKELNAAEAANAVPI